MENAYKVHLELMTRELCHEFYRGFENDHDIFADMSLFKEYEYDKTRVDERFDKHQTEDRVMFAIMLEDRPIGELVLKNIDREKGECTMSIHMQNDSVKGFGYGTQAERLAIEYAFDTLKMNTVKADAILKNKRSQHIMEKLGFICVGEEDGFRYYEIYKVVE